MDMKKTAMWRSFVVCGSMDHFAVTVTGTSMIG